MLWSYRSRILNIWNYWMHILITYPEENKATEFNIHLFSHIHKLVLSAFQKSKVSQPLPSHTSPLLMLHKTITTCHCLFLWVVPHYLLRHGIIWGWDEISAKKKRRNKWFFHFPFSNSFVGKRTTTLFRKTYFKLLSWTSWQGWAEIQELIWRDSLEEVMDDRVPPPMLAVISPCRLSNYLESARKLKCFPHSRGNTGTCLDLQVPAVHNAVYTAQEASREWVSCFKKQSPPATLSSTFPRLPMTRPDSVGTVSLALIFFLSYTFYSKAF